MPQWIRLNKLTDEGIKSLRTNRLETFGEVKEGIEKEGGKLVGAWVTQGRYDLVSIIDAPNEDAMLAIDANIASMRIYHSVSMPGIPIDAFLKAFVTHRSVLSLALTCEQEVAFRSVQPHLSSFSALQLV